LNSTEGAVVSHDVDLLAADVYRLDSWSYVRIGGKVTFDVAL